MTKLVIQPQWFGGLWITGDQISSVGGGPEWTRVSGGRVVHSLEVRDSHRGSWCCISCLSLFLYGIIDYFCASKQWHSRGHFTWGVLLWHKPMFHQSEPSISTDLDQWECSSLEWRVERGEGVTWNRFVPAAPPPSSSSLLLTSEEQQIKLLIIGRGRDWLG